MPKYVPEIRISAAEHVRRDYESHSECGMSDVATDCEVLEANYSKKPKASKPKQESFDDGVLLTDIDGSSDDEKETVVRYPIDCINSILDLGMSCEEVSNSQGPLKKQKSITCSLEKRSRPLTLNNERFDDGGTDVEGMFMSEEDEEYRIDSDIDLAQFEPQAYVSVSDKVITGTIFSPRVTPEPGAERKKRISTLRSPVPISSVLTDTEMIISDTESNTTRSKKMTKVRPFRTFFDGFNSDTEDSDASENIPKLNVKQNKKLSCSRSFDTFNKVSVIKNNMLAPIRRKGSDCEQCHTDTEHIYFDERAQKNETKPISRPSVIEVNQSVLNKSGSVLRHRQNVAKSKSNQGPNMHVRARGQEKPQKQAGYPLMNVPMQEDTGNATDIEAFGSDSDGQVDDIKAVAYLPNPKCEMVIDNESHKGKMSIILPITNSHKNKTLKVEDLDCGYSDVEDLPGYEPEDYFRYPTPEVPRHTYMTEHSVVENKESLIDQAKLSVEISKPEPLTDTEELDLNVGIQAVKSQLKVRIPQRPRKVSECHTDVEDLDGSDHENKQSLDMEDIDPVVLTDVGDFSSDDSDDDIFRFTAVTPDLELNNTYTTAREAMSPFSFEVKKRINDSIPKIRTISPSPIPRNHTDTEDFIASQESAGSNWDYSDDGHTEPHSSVIHIKHTRKFNERAERDHIKGFFSRPDPTTDVEELTMMEALEELSQKKRKHQKMKEQNAGIVRTCYSGPKGPKINSRGYKSSGKHGIKNLYPPN